MAKKKEVVITCNATNVKAVIEGLERGMAALAKEEENLLNVIKQRGYAEDAEKKRLKELETAMDAMRTNIQNSKEETKKMAEVLADLANAKLKDVTRALNEGKSALRRMSENDPKRAQLNKELAELARQIEIIGGKSQSLAEAKRQLNDLANTPTEKLRQGLAAINKEMDLTDDKTKRAELKGYARQYEAQMAVNQYGNGWATPVSSMNEEQLRAEQQRLRSLYSATNGAKGFELVEVDALNRLHLVNDALAEIRKNVEAIDLSAVDFDNLDTTPLEKLDAMLKQIEKDEKTLAATDKQKSEEMARNKRKVQEAIQRVKNQNIDLANAQKVAGDTSKYSVQQLQTAYDTLKQHLMSLSTGQEKEIAKTKKQMTEVKNKIDEVTGAASKQSSIWKNAVRNITAYVGVFGAFNLIKNKLMEVIRGSEELSDQMAKVRMVSGLAMEDIEGLTRSLAKLDTRTTLTDLNELAYVGSKLGFGEMGVGALEDFVKAANQVNVALKEDLGSEAMTALSKITENMGLIKKMGVEQAMLATSSAMFKLFTSSTAAAGPIVEVTKRLAPMAQISGFATHEILALASASDALMQSEEVAGTAMSKFMMAMQNNHNVIEKTLGMTEGSIATMMKSGKSMEAFLTILDKMSGKNVTELQNVWKLLGSEGDRLIRVILAMANHTDLVRQHLNTSTKAFKEATAVTEEYNIQQETAMAYLERADNKWRNAFINPDSALAVKEMTKAWYDFTKSITDSDTALGAIKTTVDFLLISLRVLIALLPGITFGLLAKGAAMLAAKLGLAKIATDGFTLSWKKMDAATKSNWIGLIVGTVVQAVFWFKEWASSMSDVEKEQKKLNDAIDKMHEKAETEIKSLDRLKHQLDDTNISQEERNALLAKVRSDYDIYLNYLGIEKNKVDDLTKHYDALVKVMKQRFAYEEREDYKRDVMGGEGGVRMKRRNASSALKKMATEMGIKDLDIDAEIMPLLQQGKSVEQVMEVIAPELKRATENISKAEEAARTAAGPGAAVGKRGNQNQKYLDLKASFQAFADAVKREKEMEAQIDAAFASEIGDFDYDKWLRTQVMGEFVIQPDKAEQRAQREDMKRELQEAKRNAEAVMSKVEEWYRLQETAITSQLADGILSEKESKDRIRELNIYKNQALEYVRSAITGRDTESWDEFKENMGAMMMDMGEWSQELLKEVQDVDISAVREAINRFNGSAEVFYISAASVRDAIDKNAAGNKREQARLQAEAQKEVEDLLRKYQYFEQARDKFYDDLMSIGAIGETAEEMAVRMQEGKPRDKKKEIMPMIEALSERFRGLGAQAYQIDPENAQEIADLITQMIYDNLNQDGEPAWTLAFPNLELWAKDAEIYKDDLKNLYQVMLTMESDYYKASKQMRDQDEKDAKERWSLWGWDTQEKRESAAFERQENLRKIQGEGENFGQTYGFADTIADDPEIARIKNRMEWRARELEDLQARNASEELIMEKQNEMLKEAAALAEKVSAEVANRISKVQTLSEPLNSFGEEIGQMLGEQWQGISQEGKLTFGQMAKNMGIEYAKLTLKMASENLMKKLQQGLFYKQMEMQEMQHQVQLTNIQNMGNQARIAGQIATGTALQGIKAAQDATEIGQEGGKATVMTMFGISSGAAKTIAQLGWWGIPLIGVITSILMGLLNSAKATAGQESSKSSTSNSNTKTKLVSNMLTYDKGNVGSVSAGFASGKRRYLGQDGKVYTATEEPAPKDGLVTHPIATTVQGQPALVAEKGPEIVIGRETTKAIMMNEPELIKYLANYHQYGGRRLLDSGNVESVAMPSQPAERGTDAEREALRQQMSQMQEVMNGVLYYLQHPVRPKISMYSEGGEDGLYDSMKKANKFMARYGG